MSIEYTHDYANHTLLDSRNKYTELYKLAEADAFDVCKGDILLLKTACGKYGIYIAAADPDEDGTLHLSRYTEVDYIKMEE